ncbi:uncharacterized protein K460DRAFT_417088 [Cucurbitaria berberidis CBS 394.84]|uniref:Mid2 domain-containing protein n=1 Tax=Cucurbitaria berberidis CBS 394.84 TaxID=1168544 RepID=A0A9P4GGX1_9PLEO|nr:uncharacterized protein K460DRAFT_417088 [Cucurbitaria berberidis CBS 394.84]KAF1845898.1 hypothetical protein K460DRAFT_417088 [Cucurbitaria berberidis CBS 394.84]
MGGLGSLSAIALLHLTLFLLLGFNSNSVGATCFFPDGTTADSGHKECNPNSTDATTCCAEGFQCLSNGLCNDYRYQNWTRVLRGACTQQDFGGGCNKVCTDFWPQGDEAVWYCGSGAYCCSRANDCCQDNNVQKHILAEPSVVAIAGKTSPSTTPTHTTTPPAQSSNAASSSSTSGSSTNTRTIAIAVGVVAGILLLLLVGLWFIRRKRKARKTQPMLHELSAADGAPHVNDTTQPYTYDDKRGGWVTGANGNKNKKKEKGARGRNVLYEVPSDRVVEMPAEAEVKEIDGMGSGARGGAGRGVHHVGGAEMQRNSLVGNRPSRFVEVDMASNSRGDPTSRERLDRYQ